VRGLGNRFLAVAADAGGNVDFPRWLRGTSRLPAWQVALTAALILLASVMIPGASFRHHSHPATGGAPLVADSLPVDLPVPAPAVVTQPQPKVDANADQQIAGLHVSTQELLKQIDQARQENAALRAQIQAQDQTLGTTQSEVAATDAERTQQQRQIQSQTGAVIATASAQLAQLNQAVTTLDSQAKLLRSTAGMSPPSYPPVTVPNLATSADPLQAVDTALNSLQAHITAVTNDLQTVKSRVQSELAFAQSAGVRPVGAGTSVHGTGQLAWPTTGTITQPYGPTSLDLEPAYAGYAHFHLGVDIATSQGTPIGAAAAGTVIFAGWTDAGYGNMVEIDHGNGLVTIYGHMMSTPSVHAGQHVFKGQLIGYVGTTGNSTGPHVHFGVQFDGAWDNPYKYLP
jgi:murein DD-endopeptidase MepM/ murein hydrolase activator NlpD